ncbi:MAG: GAP family protein [Actinobacteria bacterium]|nr:GAP family protein [Actinomycetota bacterium]MBU1943253.1 GAP family protein [Actinomycetota bacterium]MBU2688998.1 GAP family protein [Actinomycetota bacterium]
MGDVIGNILPLALGVAISPVPIIAVILMLFSGKAKVNSLAFLLGWVAGLSAAFWIVYAVASAADVATSSGASKGTAVLRLVLGVLLLFMALRNWRKRPGPGEEPEMPKWMSAIDGFTPHKSLGLAALLSGVNPKNLVLTLAASMAIAQGGLATGEIVISFAIFLAIGAATVAVPVVVNLVMGARAEKTLNAWKAWLTENNATVMFVLLLVFGVVLIGKGISGLV